MVQVSRRTSFNGSTLVRLLARLTDVDVPESRRPFADRLSLWLGWTDAITLSSALNGSAPMSSSSARALQSDEEREYTRARTALTKAVAQDVATLLRSAAASGKPDFAPYRRHYVGRQQAMESTIGPLRARLRKALEHRSPAMAQLAALDAVMEHVLSAQEHRLLATVPGWLEKHFRRMAQSGQATADRDDQDDQENKQADQTPAWQDAFGNDMQSVLLAELDIRLQPVEGLLEALRTH